MKAVKILTLVLLVMFFSPALYSHCDAIDGPVIKAAKKALENEDVNLVLIWIQKEDEQEIINAFNNTLEVRKLSERSKELADYYFFETLVRVHRNGEGAPYTGLKPAGYKIEEGIMLADKAIEESSVEHLEHTLMDEFMKSLNEKYQKVLYKKSYAVNDITAGREYVKAYVEFIHFAEKLNKIINVEAHHGEHKH